MTHTSTEKRSHLWLIGGGGHAAVVAEAARLAGQCVTGYFDDRIDTGIPDCPHLGPIAQATVAATTVPKIFAIGDLVLRRGWMKRIPGPFATVIHSTAIVAVSAEVGGGTFIGAGAVVNSCATLAPHVIVNTRAVIEHDCQIGVNAHVGPGAILGGGVNVGTDTLIGINASVRPNIVIGRGCTIGAGATVVKDVPDGAIVVGVPARPIAYRRSA